MGNSFLRESKNKDFIIRLLAMIMAIVLFVCAIPSSKVYATEQQSTEIEETTEETAEEAGENTTENATEEAAEGETEVESSNQVDNIVKNAPWETDTVTGSSDPTLPAPDIKDMIAGTKSVPAEENLYVLTVATGIKAGDCVHYFAVRYTDNNGANRTKYIFPHQDAFQTSYKYMNEKGGENAAGRKRHEILNSLGYSIGEPTEPTALAPWSVDEYLFKAPHGLATINCVEVFVTSGSWNVQGVTVSKVETVAGYGEYGFYSGKYFFGLGKQKLAEFTKKKANTITISAKSDSLIELCGDNSSYFDIDPLKEEEPTGNNPFDDLYSIRIDFADNQDAGIESYLRTSANDLDPASGNIVEDLAIQLEYKDKNGWTRNVVMPVVLSAIGQYVESGDEVRTYGLCQRGETIAFTACLPEISTIVNTQLYVGTGATSIIKSSCGIDYASPEAAQAKQAMADSLANDSVAIAGVSIYDGTCRLSNIGDGVDSKTGNSYKAVSTAYSFYAPQPSVYYTTTNDNGLRISSGSSEKLSMKSYSSENPLIGITNKKNFLVRLHTDTMDHAATTGEIFVKIKYKTSSGSERSTGQFNVKSQVQSYMGYWPSTSTPKSDFAYYYGVRPDGTIEFPIELTDVTAITNIEVSLGNGEDDWQMLGLSVAYVPEIGPRRVYLQPTSAQKESSAFRMVRTSEKADIPPFPLGLKRHFDPGEGDSWDVDTGQSTGIEELDYSSMRYSMTYEQTQQNLGFVNSKKTYDITVDVADDSDTSNTNGDSGSSNQFYFQLQFKNGNSAVVLANQQLSSDGFRAGCKENFSISVNRDYGALTAVRVIPEDVTEESEIFDKLNIDQIVVTEQSNGGAAMQYIVDSVGWIGIDYHDSAEDNSIKGREGRMMSDMSINKYNVSYQRRVVNLLCEVMTLPWEIEDYLQVEGSISSDITYIDTDGQPQTISFDVISRMAQYMNKTPISYDPPGNADATTLSYYKNMTTVSDPEWMLRPNHTDRFILPAIPNLQTFKSMTFYATSRNNKPAQWVIGDIAISQIIEDGPVMLTSDNEYYRDLTTQPLCRMASDKEKVSMLLPAGEMQTMTVEFTENQLVWSEEESWVSPVTRLPESTEDTLNIYVYPSEHSRQIEGNNVDFAVQYAMPFTNPQQSKGALRPIESGKDTACLVATGVRASGMATLNSLTLRCMNPSMAFDRAIVQQVREGVIVSTYYINFNNSSGILGVTAKPSNIASASEPREQIMYISLGTDTAVTTLFAEQNDIAVSFKYRTSLDLGATEYYSPYVYLTDVGIGKIYPGLMLEVPFNIPYVTDITGYRIVSFGGVQATVEGVLFTNSSYSSKTTDEVTKETITNDLTRLGVYSSAEITEGNILVPVTVGNTIIEKRVTAPSMTTAGAINPLDITFTTAEALATGESGTNAPVRTVFNYIDQAGAARSRVVADIRQYMQRAERSFMTGTDARIRLFLPECMELLSIDIQPYDDSGTANWTISSISGSLALGEKLFNRMVNQQFTQVASGSIYIKEIALTTYYSLNGNASQLVTNHQAGLGVNSGERLNVSVVVADGSGFTVKIYWKVNDELTEITGSLLKDLTATGFYLFAPETNATTPQTYIIEIASKANPSVKDVINMNVNPKNNGTLNDVIKELQNNQKWNEEQAKKQAEEAKKQQQQQQQTTPDSGNTGTGDSTGTNTGGTGTTNP